MRKNIFSVSFILAAFSLFQACNDAKPEVEKPKYVIADSLVKTLRIDSVMSCPLVNSLTLTGKVSFNDEKVSRIYPMVSGVISEVTAQVGDYVQKGQQLGVIRSSEMAGY